MQGIVCIWSGAIVDIPAGWLICDGTNDTPDLRNLFVIGAGGTYNPDDTGGAATHQHNFTSADHFHTLPAGMNISYGANLANTTDSKVVTGTTDATSSLPPYHALAYIMKE